MAPHPLIEALRATWGQAVVRKHDPAHAETAVGWLRDADFRLCEITRTPRAGPRQAGRQRGSAVGTRRRGYQYSAAAVAACFAAMRQRGRIIEPTVRYQAAFVPTLPSWLAGLPSTSTSRARKAHCFRALYATRRCPGVRTAQATTRRTPRHPKVAPRPPPRENDPGLPHTQAHGFHPAGLEGIRAARRRAVPVRGYSRGCRRPVAIVSVGITGGRFHAVPVAARPWGGAEIAEKSPGLASVRHSSRPHGIAVPDRRLRNKPVAAIVRSA
jgi:hypothetical protein